MSAVDDAWEKHRRDIAGQRMPDYSDREAGFRHGWRAAMRYRDAQGEPLGLFGASRPAGLNSSDLGPAWTPSSGQGETADTSLEAAASMAGRGAAAIRELVLETITSRPSTDQEIAELLGLPENTVRPRRIELRDRGVVFPHGRRRTKSGRLATVWHCPASKRADLG